MQAVSDSRTHTPWILFLTVSMSICISLIACRSQKEAQTNQSRNEPQTQRYEVKGKVVSIDKPQKQMVVDHEAIPGFMRAMAMPYAVKDSKSLDTLAPGDQITAQVVVIGDSVWLENIVVVKKETKSGPTGQFYSPEAGEEVASLVLVNQSLSAQPQIRGAAHKFTIRNTAEPFFMERGLRPFLRQTGIWTVTTPNPKGIL